MPGIAVGLSAIALMCVTSVVGAQAATHPLPPPAGAASTTNLPMVAHTTPAAASSAGAPNVCSAPSSVADHISPGDVVVSKGKSTSSVSAGAGPVAGGATGGGARVREWTVHVASYESLDEAGRMQQTLCQRGYDARIIGAGRPYGVRVGRYPTSKAALDVARHLTSRKLTVYVTPAE